MPKGIVTIYPLRLLLSLSIFYDRQRELTNTDKVSVTQRLTKDSQKFAEQKEKPFSSLRISVPSPCNSVSLLNCYK